MSESIIKTVFETPGQALTFHAKQTHDCFNLSISEDHHCSNH